MKKRFTIIFSFITTAVISQERIFAPPNEFIKDTSLTIFIKNLKTAVQKKDSTFIYNSLSTNVKNGFGIDSGMAVFRRRWQLKYTNSGFWNYVSRIIEMPGCFLSTDMTTSYIIPYVSCLPMTNRNDSLYASVIVVKNAPLKKASIFYHPDSKTIAILSYDVVRDFNVNDHDITHEAIEPIYNENKDDYIHDYHYRPQQWHLITVKSNKNVLKGWVNNKYIYRPFDYRLILRKENNCWLIDAFGYGKM